MPLMMPDGREVEWVEGEMEGEKTWELVFEDDCDDMLAYVCAADAQFRWEVIVGPEEWPKPGYEPTLEAAKEATQRALGVRRTLRLMLDGREVKWTPVGNPPEAWMLVYYADPMSTLTRVLQVGSGWQILAMYPGAVGRGSFSDPDDAKVEAERALGVVKTP